MSRANGGEEKTQRKNPCLTLVLGLVLANQQAARSGRIIFIIFLRRPGEVPAKLGNETSSQPLNYGHFSRAHSGKDSERREPLC